MLLSFGGLFFFGSTDFISNLLIKNNVSANFSLYYLGSVV